jgi:membrane protease YdiL (CAAX protease family)
MLHHPQADAPMMSTSSAPRPRPVSPWLSALVVVLWIAGALLCRSVGVWGGIGSAALVAGSVTLLGAGRAVLPLLRPRRELVLQGIGAGAVMIAATYLLFPLLSRLAPGLAASTSDLYALFNSGAAPVRLGLLPLVILGEELVWRGLVQGTVGRKGGAGAVAAAGIYALAHLPAAPPLLALVAFACGCFWGALRTASGSLVPGLVAHLLWDVAVMVLFPLR